MIYSSSPPAETKISIPAILLSTLPCTEMFTAQLKAAFLVEEFLMADSARSLLYLLFQCLKESDEKGRNIVLLPGYTCYSVAAAAVKAGLKIRLYDLNPASMQPDILDFKKKIGPETLAVVGQHLFGIPGVDQTMIDTAKELDVMLIEDAAQMLGRSSSGNMFETIGDFSVYSFGRGKPLPLGCGGLLVGKKKAVMDMVKQRLEPMGAAAVNPVKPLIIQLFAQPWLYWIVEKLPLGLGKTIYDPGFVVTKMPLFYQRLGAKVLVQLSSLNRHRKNIGQIYNDFFLNTEPRSRKNQIAYVRYPLLVSEEAIPGELQKYGVRKMYPEALCDLDPLRQHLCDSGSIPLGGSRIISKTIITLPTHLGVNEHFALEIAKSVSAYYAKSVSVVSV